MRYIKIISKPLKVIKLKKWEELVIEAMNIAPFFTFIDKNTNTNYFLAYISDDALLDNFNKDYISSMFIQELNKKEVKKIINTQSPNFICKFNKFGKISVQKINIHHNNIYNNPHKKPYNSWVWNFIENKWQAPVPHPVEGEGLFILDKLSSKWIENPNYLLYNWNEEKNRWDFVGNQCNKDNIMI